MNEQSFCANICVHFARAVFEQITRHNFDQSERTKVTPETLLGLSHVYLMYVSSSKLWRVPAKDLDIKTADDAELEAHKSSKCERHQYIELESKAKTFY